MQKLNCCVHITDGISDGMQERTVDEVALLEAAAMCVATPNHKRAGDQTMSLSQSLCKLVVTCCQQRGNKQACMREFMDQCVSAAS